LPYNDLKKVFRAETKIQKIFSRKDAKGAKLFHNFKKNSRAKTLSPLSENSEQKAAGSKKSNPPPCFS